MLFSAFFIGIIASIGSISALPDAVEKKVGRGGKTFKFGQTSVGLMSVSPMIKRMYAKKFEKTTGGNNGGDGEGDLIAAPPPINDANESDSEVESGRMTTGLMNGFEVKDDLDAEYANQYLKRGLVFLDDREGGGSFDREFMSTLRRFHASLLQKPAPTLPDISAKWKSYSGEKAYRTERLYTKWKSVDCGILDMRLKMVESIYDSHRNRVIKLFDRNTQQLYAYKTYGNADEFYSELEMFLWLDHPYFAKAVCHRKDTDSGKAGILFEYVDGMSSIEYARQASNEQLLQISAQLFLAMEHLHWLGVVHADLKPENVLIRKDGTVQVIDLGFAIHLPQARRRRGTHTTMAPELHSLVPGKCHEGIDWWAYGSTIAMWYGVNLNFRNNNDGKRFVALDWREGRFVDGVVPWRFTQELRSFLQIFFQPSPESRRIHTKRLLKQIRNEPFFKDVDWTMLKGGVLN